MRTAVSSGDRSVMAESRSGQVATLQRELYRDPAAFDAMVVREAPRVERLAGRLMLWRGDIDDVVQEVFVQAWSQRDKFRGDSPVSTWLGGITINVCRRLRRRQRLWNLFLVNSYPRQLAFEGNDQTEIAAKEQLLQALEQLRQTDRELLVLRWLEGRSISEIAMMTGINVKAAEVRLTRARARLKKVLGPDHD